MIPPLGPPPYVGGYEAYEMFGLTAQSWQADLSESILFVRCHAAERYATHGTAKSVISRNPGGALSRRGAVLTSAATVA